MSRYHSLISLHTQELRFVLLTDVVECYEILSRASRSNYFGAPNIKEHVPENSIVHVDDFESHDALVSHLMAILSDEDLPSWFVSLYVKRCEMNRS